MRFVLEIKEVVLGIKSLDHALHNLYAFVFMFV